MGVLLSTLWWPAGEWNLKTSGYQFSPVAQSCPTHWDPMDCSMPGFPIHQLPELAQTHVHWVDGAIQLSSSSVVPFCSCLQSFSTSGSFPVSQLSTWGGQSIVALASASVLPVNFQDWFPEIIPKNDWFDLLAVQETLKSGYMQMYNWSTLLYTWN